MERDLCCLQFRPLFFKNVQYENSLPPSLFISDPRQEQKCFPNKMSQEPTLTREKSYFYFVKGGGGG